MAITATTATVSGAAVGPISSPLSVAEGSRRPAQWSSWLLPSSQDVSFGWEHDPRPTSKQNSPAFDSNRSSLEQGDTKARTGSSTPELVNTSSPTSSSTSLSADDDPDSSGSLSSTRTKQPALLIRSHSQGWARCFELHSDWFSPQLVSPDEVLVKNITMGLNPVDWKSLMYRFGIQRFPWVLGRDVCAVVEKVGAGVDNVKVGDRVWTCSDSRDIRSGAYQALSIHKAFTLGKVPDGIPDDNVATIGTGLVTAAVALYWFFGLERAREVGGGQVQKDDSTEEKAQEQRQDKDGLAIRRMTRSSTGREAATKHTRGTRWLLIFGGGAITGLYALQLAHLSSSDIKVVCVASPTNFEHLHSLGADACVDRFLSATEILESVKKITSDNEGTLDWALDCVGSQTASLCQEMLATSRRNALTEETGQLICLAGNPKRPRSEDDNQSETRGGTQTRGASLPTQSVTTHRISFSTTYYSSHSFTSQLVSDVETLLTSGSLRTVEPLVLSDGLAGVRRGLEMLRDGKCPRTKKLVVRMSQTPKDLEVTVLGKKEEVGWNGCV